MGRVRSWDVGCVVGFGCWGCLCIMAEVAFCQMASLVRIEQTRLEMAICYARA